MTPNPDDNEQPKNTPSEHVGNESIYEGDTPIVTYLDQPPTRIQPDLPPLSVSVPHDGLISRRFSLTEENETRTERLPTPESDRPPEEKPKPISWSQLPEKGQLAILVLARLSEPLTQTSLQSYLFYQLKSFNPSVPDSSISSQAGIIQGSFTASQFLTAIWWGRLADASWMGRKRVLLIGLSGTFISCLGFGFSRSFTSAIIFRILGGLMNSNVGVMRTMVAEIVEEKKYQSRAFLLLPMCFNIGVIIGPSLGGFLADPISNFPGLFGPGSVFGGKNGVWWMQQWPYALPNLISAIFIIMSLTAVFLGLNETHEIARYRPDWGRELGKSITRWFRGQSGPRYTRINNDPDEVNSVDFEHGVSEPSSPVSSRQPALPLVRKSSLWKQVFTKNVIFTLLTHFLLAMHTSAFNSMTFVFLPMPRAEENSRSGWFHFSGGLGLSSSQVGIATSVIGIIGLPLQLFVYPRVQFRLGTLRSFRTFLPLSPLAYALMPFLVLIPRLSPFVWPSFTFVVALQVISRTFALPAAIILVNNSVTDPSVLGTVHGIAQSISSGARTLGPFLGGLGLGLGLLHNIVGAVWWALAVEATLGWLVSWTVQEGKGIERKKKPARE
ncbi:putative MFS multidrug transporter [Talaromyces proteolyticus]|uniref:MFS multidrug transporter n=1 Tax=Talaromyces proteolyticus TaxID=1131652 RepID=A0AAD4Q292_9EURO|nr:putative MFS multidrug transporter [Talaromyces proteolyticus]KAH8700222.1 putative MFS multidrug transporter [Talaromyces proteolyticus]